MPETKHAQLTVRVPGKLKRRFLTKCREYGTPSVIYRELLEAFVDGRLRVNPETNRPMLEKFYNDHRI